MANGSLFRKKNLDRVASPEQLDQYIRVSSPRAWMMLAALVLLLVAAAAYIMLATVPDTQTVQISVHDGRISGSTGELEDGFYTAEVTCGEKPLRDLILGS